LESQKQFVQSENYCGEISITFKYIYQITNLDLLNACKYAFNEISLYMQKTKIGYEGTNKFTPFHISKIFYDKTINFSMNSNNTTRSGVSQTHEPIDEYRYDLSNKD
jgi:hypothetical protein